MSANPELEGAAGQPAIDTTPPAESTAPAAFGSLDDEILRDLGGDPDADQDGGAGGDEAGDGGGEPPDTESELDRLRRENEELKRKKEEEEENPDDEEPPDPEVARTEEARREEAVKQIFSLDLDLDDFTEGNEPMLAKRLKVLGQAAHAMYRKQLEMEEVANAYRAAEGHQKEVFLLQTVTGGAEQAKQIYGVDVTPQEVAQALQKFGRAIAEANGGQLPADAGILAWQLANRSRIASGPVKQPQAKQGIPATSRSAGAQRTQAAPKGKAGEQFDEQIARELGLV